VPIIAVAKTSAALLELARCRSRRSLAHVEWLRPTTELLRDQHDRIAAALVGDTAQFAPRHVIHGLSWE
jgi:hypothetical protein